MTKKKITTENWKWKYNESKGSPHEKKNVFFWALPEKGGGETPARIFWPFFPPCFPLYFDINIMLCDTFWSFLTPNHQKYQNNYHNYHSHHCRNHRYLVLYYAQKRRFWRPKKVVQLARFGGRGAGGRGNLGNAWKKSIFLMGGLP